MALDEPHLRDDVVMLRRAESRDVDQIVTACQDPDIPRYTRVPTPYTRRDCEGWLQVSADGWAAGTDAPLLIVDAHDDALVLGSTGLHRISPERDYAEVGYWIEKSARRRGIATRALRLVSRWAVVDLGISRVELMADVENVASQRVAEAAGFTREGVLRSFFRHRRGLLDVAMYSLVPGDLREA